METQSAIDRSETIHACRVRATFDFIGILPVTEGGDPQKAVREAFRFWNAEIRGFAEQRRELVISTAPIQLPPPHA
jgi:hypothetical protein